VPLRLRKFWQLSGSGQKLLLQAFFLLPLMDLALRFIGFKRTHTVFANLFLIDTTRTMDTAKSRTQVYLTTKMVEAAARHGPYRANCLAQSLVLWWLLRRQGIEGDLRIGVRKTTGLFEAHAWVEWLGFVLNENQDVHQRFAAFDRPIFPVGAKVG
jgi:Transglutaminase-like superfamily